MSAPAHFMGLTGASTLNTRYFQLARHAVTHLVAHQATGVIYGPAGTGKTFAVHSALAEHAHTQPVVLVFPSHPTMRVVADELLFALTGERAPVRRNRFQLISSLVDHLAGAPRLVVVDEAQRLNSDCLELLRHLHDHTDTRFALLYVGGNGCWEVLSAEPMLRSRLFRMVPFKPQPRQDVVALMRAYHPIHTHAPEELLLEVDDTFAHGTLRDWASFTHTAAALCAEQGTDTLNEAVLTNAYALLGGGAGG